MTFREKLVNAAQRNGSLLCVGLDPDPSRLHAADVTDFLCSIIEATSDLVCAYKPNLAFYEQMGDAGYRSLRAVLAAIPEDIPVIADAKRGDIGHTAEAYARAIFDELGFDAATVSPYLGGDSVEPFLVREDKAAIIVCRTSNAGAGDFQDLPVDFKGERRPLYEVVAERAKAWNTRGNVGLVAGATYPAELARLRELCPDMLFLVPGVGAQEGDLEAAVRAGLDADNAGIIVNASRQVLYDSEGGRSVESARREALSLRDAIERERTGERQELRA
ncbi:MAG: orotidine-5'-phosphate decarboxylase [Chloroflexi bacterium]|nr:orotidine-5'-phosphate decarboxylase [Chloroflexota bacterium]